MRRLKPYEHRKSAPRSIAFASLGPAGGARLHGLGRIANVSVSPPDMAFRTSLFAAGAGLTCGLAGCAAPQIGELRATPPTDEITVSAPLPCLYEKGAERVYSYLGMTEPKFQGYINSTGTDAWFRQPLTLVELHAKAPAETVVRRRQTPSAAALGQAGDLMQYLSKNPCSEK